ncbi:hypothetical protein GPECTOR_2g1577 [Gonium pectorale]|uniref:Major facilitator superfamily (MFS) profile domain-containing protein n=1 Tax=Gonium pectorale TaxID=33097 RepID=A0A150H1U2_GONPE|nr:hypothetical protein GPECTOR_2g1577 [Gonium pectorale]|eukprot:KXZ56025.1 hypothetical protein GPECTOR_2g1577 [Gonium pectorale]
MLTTPFTIGVFMVRDFEAAKHGADAVDEQVVGRLTGLLAGIFSFAGFLTAYAWGCASNYVGRKPVIVIGTAVSLVSMLWFGLSGSYGTALAARAFGGFFNGILGAWKCMIGESTAVLLQGKFFGYMSLAWGLGCIAGPAMGGAFSRPCDGRLRLPLCRPGQLLRARPYFLACLVGSTTLLASLLLCVFLLEETLPEAMRERGLAARLEEWRRRRRAAAQQHWEETRPLRAGESDEPPPAAAPPPPASSGDDPDGGGNSPGCGGSSSVAGGAKDAPAGKDGGGGDGDGGQGDEEGAPAPLLPWYRYPQIVLTILGYGITALIFCALDEVFPIFAAAPREAGGLGMREEQIAPPLMFFGAVLMPYSLYGYPPLQRAIGTLRLTRVGLLVTVAACLMVPLVASVRSASSVGAMLVLYSSMVVKAFAQCSAFTGSIIAVNAAPAPEQLGAVNGVGQTLAALVRGVGPATGGLLWAASVGLHAAGQQFLTFAFIAVLAVGNYVLFRFVRLPGMK